MAKNSTAVLDETPEVVIELEPEITTELQAFRQQVEVLQNESRRIAVVDEAGEGAALIFIAGVTKISRNLEEYRDSLVRPHNSKVKKINASVKEIADLAGDLVRAMDAERCRYVEEKQRLIDEQNRLAAAKAEAERLAKESKEKALRDEAERLQREVERIEAARIQKEIDDEAARLAAEKRQRDAVQAAMDAKRQGDLAAARKLQQEAERARLAEQERQRLAEEARIVADKEKLALERQQIKAEAKADVMAEQASMVAPTIQHNSSMGSRALTGGGSAGTKEVDEGYMLNGTPVYSDPIKKKYTESRGDDERLEKDIPMMYFDFNMGRALRAVKDGHAVPGFALKSKIKTTVRK
mgnify:CR=1 FL=1